MRPRALLAMFGFIVTFTAFPTAQEFFPKSLLSKDGRSDQFHAEWYSEQLRALGETPLWQNTKCLQTYRFLWLRSFHHPVSIRVEVASDGTALLTTKIGSGQGGYEPGRLVESRVKKLSKMETQWFLDRVEEVGYWNLPGPEEENPNVARLDGVQWIVEGVKDGRYHVVDRWSPEKGPVRSLGLIMLLDLAKLKLLYQDVY